MERMYIYIYIYIYRSETFWVIAGYGNQIVHEETFVIQKKDIMDKRRKMEFYSVFFVSYPNMEEKAEIEDNLYNISVISDRWTGLEINESIYLNDIRLPIENNPQTPIDLKAPLVPISRLKNPIFESLYSSKFAYFNRIQSHIFETLYEGENNVLIGAPTGSGKTIMAELAMLRIFRDHPNKKVLYIAPLKALAKERIIDWKKRIEGILHKKVVELTGDYTPDLRAIRESRVIISTPEKWDGISRHWQEREYVQEVGLLVIDEIHLLGQDRGPVLEVIVSRMRHISSTKHTPVRFIGLSTALANAQDVADWLGVPLPSLFNFGHQVRPVPITVYVEGFTEKAYCPRMATMNKPTYNAIKAHSYDKPVLVFVSSRRQTRLTALDLISYSAIDEPIRRPFLWMDEDIIADIAETITDDNLKHTLQFGIGMHHAGLTENVDYLYIYYI